MAKLNWKTPNGTTGNVDLDKIFTTDGGTINGNIKFNSADESSIYMTNNSCKLTIGGGDDFDTGASIVLTGKDSSDAGIMGLHVHDGTNNAFIGIYTDRIRAMQSRLSLGSNPNKYNIWIPSEHQPSNTNTIDELKIMASAVEDSGNNWHETPGAKLALRRADTADQPGSFGLIARDNSQYSILRGTADGALTWASHDVFTSAGGTLTGALTIDQSGNVPLHISTTGTAYRDIEVNHTDGNRVGVIRFTRNSTSNDVVIGASDAKNSAPSGITVSRTLGDGTTAGTVTCTAQTPATSDNSTKIATTAYVKSNLSSYLPLSGGTMTGAIRGSSSDLTLIKTDTNGRTVIRGGNDYNNCASLYLHGKDHSDSAIFQLMCNNGTNSSTLIGKPDGTLTWGGKNVLIKSDISTGSNNGTIAVDGTNVAVKGLASAAYNNWDNAVHTSGAQTIQGNKTFTADMFFTNDAPKIIQINSNDAIGTKPSSDQTWHLRFFDKNSTNLGSVQHQHETDNSHCTCLFTRDKGNAHWAACIVRLTASAVASVEPYSTKTHSLGTSSKLWTTVYAQTAAINTSDERAKTLIENIPDAILDIWGNVNLVRYKLKDSINEKGENARFHTGCIAQNIDAEFKKVGLDPREYGFFCYDEWDGKEATYDENGVEQSPEIIAGNQYSIRYEEALIIEAAYQRRRADRLEERVARLEALLETN